MKLSPIILAAATALTPVVAQDFSGYLFVNAREPENQLGGQPYFRTNTHITELGWVYTNGGYARFVSRVGTGGIQDPTIIRSRDNKKYWIIATDINTHADGGVPDIETGSRSLAIFESPDLYDWSDARLVEVSPEDAGATWYPDAIWDPARRAYMVFWASHFPGGEGWKTMRAYTSDFKAFTKAEDYDTGGGIDCNIARDSTNGRFYRFCRNQETGFVDQASANRLNGPWKWVKKGIGSWMESTFGPYVLQDFRNPNTWYLFIRDTPAQFFGGYRIYNTTDIASGAWPETDTPMFFHSARERSGSIIPVTDEEITLSRGPPFIPPPSGSWPVMPPPPPPGNQPCLINQEQCGGQLWIGCTTCAPGYFCQYVNVYFSRCVLSE